LRGCVGMFRYQYLYIPIHSSYFKVPFIIFVMYIYLYIYTYMYVLYVCNTVFIPYYIYYIYHFTHKYMPFYHVLHVKYSYIYLYISSGQISENLFSTFLIDTLTETFSKTCYRHRRHFFCSNSFVELVHVIIIHYGFMHIHIVVRYIHFHIHLHFYVCHSVLHYNLYSTIYCIVHISLYIHI
jgi:hypothetical protein